LVDQRGDVDGPIQGELDQLVERMRALTRATAAYVLMVEDNELVQRAVSGAPADGTRLRLDRPGLCSTALATGEPLLCPDLETDTRTHQGNAREHRMRSTVIVPVTAASGPVAVLIVSADEPDVFTQRDVATLELLAVVLAAALGQAAALSERKLSDVALREHSARLSGVIDAQRAIDAAGLDLDAVMELIVDRAMELTRADGAMVSLIEGDELVIAAARGLAGKMHGRRPISSSVARFAFAERGTLLIADATTDPRVNRTLQQQIGDTSMICVPLFAGDKPVAVLNVMSASETERLDEDDRRMLELLAVGLSAAVSRAAEFRAKARFEAVFASALTGMMVMDLDGTILGVNPALEDLLGRPASEMVGVKPDEFVHPDDREAAVERARRVMAGEMRSTLEHRYVRADGGIVWVDVSLSIVPATDGGGEGFIIATVQDLTRRKAAESALRAQAELNQHQALHDALTGLPNRTLFNDRIGQALHRARRSDASVAVLMLDLDRFKEVNDSLGHAAGDALLIEIGRRLDGMLRASDTVARLGGDEFGVLLPDQTCTEDVAIAAERVRAAIQEPVIVGGLPLSVDASIGIALYPRDGRELETLLQHADAAMYHAKNGSTGIAFYESSRSEGDLLRLTLVGELRRALDERELTLHYQPKARLADGSVTTVEALLRWNHPERGLVLPGEFIPIVQQTGLIEPLSRYVVDTALRQCRAWLDAGLRLAVSVNLAARNLTDGEFPAIVEALLAEHGVDGTLLEIELTESAMLADAVRSRSAIERLAALGARISIDDFGTGYFSLTQLRNLPVGEVKLDRTLLCDDVIVRSTIELGRNLGIDVVAEGVETAEAWQRLTALGCTFAQGFHLCPPLPAEELAAWCVAASR
jgi:diguanylate cyclase (GGDEF)-like protein/PAS domain S-box-containing protein